MLIQLFKPVTVRFRSAPSAPDSSAPQDDYKVGLFQTAHAGSHPPHALPSVTFDQLDGFLSGRSPLLTKREQQILTDKLRERHVIPQSPTGERYTHPIKKDTARKLVTGAVDKIFMALGFNIQAYREKNPSSLKF